jgi:tRNA pseudouridine55 synthase
LDGVIVIDKPADWTSHDVVAKVRGILKTKRVGHLGTLDPIATGVLPLVVGRATRLAQFYSRSDKTYEGTVRFGWATDTYDRAGEPAGPKVDCAIDAEVLEKALAGFRGQIEQTPPPVSAKKIGGKRAYDLARAQQPVELAPVPVRIDELTLLHLDGPNARLRVRCSGGTYIRSIAHDLGKALGCGAHIQALRRLASAEFEIDRARTLEQLAALAAEGRAGEALIPATELMPAFPNVYVDDVAVAHVRNGRNFPASPFRGGGPSQYAKAISHTGELIAVGESVLPNLYHPIVVF